MAAGRFSLKIVVAVAAIVVGFAILFGVGLKGSMVYYLTVGEFLDREGHEDLGENFRVNGNVVEGTIERVTGQIGAAFEMTDGSRRLKVHFGKETPDTFVDGSEVVVEGSMREDGVFEAHTLLAKCPSKYESSARGQAALQGAAGKGAPAAAPGR